MKITKKLLLLISTLFIIMISLVPNAYANSSVKWESATDGAYDTSIPGTILLYSNPLSQGGMNLSTYTMASEANADIVFSSDGKEIAARGIIDLGAIDFNALTEVPDAGYAKNIATVPGHVYVVSTHDGKFAKILIKKNLGSSVMFTYSLGEEEIQGPDGTLVTYDTSVPGTILLDSNPISQGGLNFSTGDMTTNANLVDIAISGTNLGARAIIDLGVVDMDSVVSEPDSGYSKMVKLAAGHVYVVQTNDGQFLKFYVKSILSSTVDLIYQEIVHDVVDIEIKGDISNITKPVQFYLEGILENGDRVAIDNSQVEWSSDNPAIATVDEAGVVTFTGKPGEVYFTANYQDLEAERGIKVTTITSIKINQKIQYSSKPTQLSVTAVYSDGAKTTVSTGITWKSNNLAVAKVDSKGVLTFTGKMGKVTITANLNGKISSVTYTVGNVLVAVQPVVKLTYSKKPVPLSVRLKYANGTSRVVNTGVTWKSSNTSVARVSSSGIVTFTGANGSVTITATYQGQSATFSTTVFLKENEVKYYTGRTWRLYANYTETEVGTLKLNTNGTYVWDNGYGAISTGKWVLNSKNTITIYNFGYKRDLTYELGRYGTNQIGIFYNNGESGSDYYIGK